MPKRRAAGKRRRAPGTACIGGKRCVAVREYSGRRYCARHLADRLFAERTWEACDGTCWAKGARGVACEGRLQCAHLLSRRYLALRWDNANAMPLCGAHHLYFTHHPLEWEDFCRNSGVDWDRLRFRALNEPPMDPVAALSWLEGEGA